MANTFLTDIDLQLNKLQNVLVDPLSADPTGTEGRVIYNSTGHVLKYYDGTSWIDPRARANHTGTQTAATISNFDSQVRTSRLDQMAAPTSAVDFNTQRITGVATPTTGTDAANKTYVDNLSVGLDFKASVRVASTANIASLSGLLTIDGVTVAANDRVLVKNQTSGAQNGIYVAQSGAWTRAADAGTGNLTSGAYVFVDQGTTQQNTSWVMTTDDPITVGTTALTWAQFSGAGQIAAGNGLTKTGDTLSVNADSGQFQFISGVLTLATGYGVRKATAVIGTGAATSIAVTHNFGTRNIVAHVYQSASPYAQVFPDVQATDGNTTTFLFATAPTSGQYTVVIVG